MQHAVPEIKKGNVNAFRGLFEEMYPALCMYAYRYVKDNEQCKDIVQEVLLLYWERRAGFDNIFQVKSFLYIVTRNRCLNFIKHESVNRHFLELNAAWSDAFHEDNLLEQETYRLVRVAVEALPPRARAVIELAMDGATNPAIARQMGIAEGTVHALKKTAYRKLRLNLHLLRVFFYF